jgi:hypothetical protein
VMLGSVAVGSVSTSRMTAPARRRMREGKLVKRILAAAIGFVHTSNPSVSVAAGSGSGDAAPAGARRFRLALWRLMFGDSRHGDAGGRRDRQVEVGNRQIVAADGNPALGVIDLGVEADSHLPWGRCSV